MFRTVFIHLFIGAFYCFYLVGCAPHHNIAVQSSIPSPHKKAEPICYYLVKKGDSLWGIANQYNVSIDSLKRKNDIFDPSQLKEGQLLVVPDFAKTSQGASSFVIPAKGEVISQFGEVVDNRINKGIKIQSQTQESIFAAMAGEVVFVGFLNGYGETIIVEHCDNISTVYSHLEDISVTQGDFIPQGHTLGKMKLNAQGDSYLLHFEVRNGQKATDPSRYVRHYEK